MQFTAFLSLKKFAFKTAQLYVAAISYGCKIRAVPDPTNHFLVKKVVEGLKRRQKGMTDSRLPISHELLIQVIIKLPAVCHNMYEAKLFGAAFTLAFYAFLRVGELTYTNGRPLEHVLSVNDVTVNVQEKSIFLKIRFSKTDQYGEGTTIKIKGGGNGLCPVAKITEYLLVRPKGNGPLLLHWDKKPLTRYQFGAVLCKAIRLNGLDHSRFKTHSFRIGAASAAAKLGYSDTEIQSAGRWRSSAFKSYIRNNIVEVPQLSMINH